MAGSTPKNDQPEDLISMTQLLKFLDGEPEPPADEAATDAAASPRITRMPQGIEVTERRLGRATGHWVLQVRCECGRRWFEIEDIHSAKCPRCGSVVLVDIEPR